MADAAAMLPEVDQPIDLSDQPVHGVCGNCNPDRVPPIIADCGFVMPEDRDLMPMPDPFRPQCEVCFSLTHCPRCGARFAGGDQP